MGATFAVNIAQHVAVAAVRRSGFGRSLLMPGSALEITGGSGRQIVYIDDIICVGTNRRRENEASSRISKALQRVGLPTSTKKAQTAHPVDPSTSLGLWWMQQGVITVKPSLLRKLQVATQDLLSYNRPTPAEVRKACGLWVWACLLQRSILSVMDSLFEFGNRPHQQVRQNFPQKARAELETLLDLLPVVQAELRLPFQTEFTRPMHQRWDSHIPRFSKRTAG